MHPIRLKLEKKFDVAHDKFEPIKFDKHTIYFEKLSKDSLELSGLFAKKRVLPNSDLPIIINSLKETARRKGFKKIKGDTWIFAEHPKIAERLGITINHEQLTKFNNIKRKYNIIKIIGINKKRTLISALSKEKPRKYVGVDCIVKTENGPINRTIKIPFDSILLPFEIKL